MQSQPVKRVVAGALAAAAVITAVTISEAPATALPTPAPQQTPPTNSADALAQYRELATQAEKLNEDYLNAVADRNAKQAEVDKANADLAAATQAGEKAAGDKNQFQVQVDEFADASFTSGAQLNKLSALLTGTSAQDFLDRASALEVLAEDKNRALSGYTGAVQETATAAQQATDARARAQAATDAANKLVGDIQSRQKTLNDQLAQLQALRGRLSTAEKAAQQDTGGAAPGLAAPTSAAQTAINAALSKLGSPYGWGDTGPSSFDCSGLTLWSYAKAGITLPRTSSSQSQFGVAVPKAQLQPGDLVYYGSPVSHIGIYLGNGKMVHAPETGDVVKISPLQNNYSGARRVAT